jgi:molecular chaperone GrpE
MTEEHMTTNGPDDAAADVSPLQRERDELYDRLLRTTADFENYRKRTERERRELSDAVTADVMRDVLPAVDDLERALAAPAGPGTDDAAQAYRRGVELIHRQLLDLLRRRGVESMDVVGLDFDPNWHEAIAHEPANGHRDGEITAELRRGYRLGQRLLRAAQVRVATA